jgi:hypothetical protein
MVRLRRGLNIADSIATRVLRQMCRAAMRSCKQLAYAHATLVEDGEHVVVDEVGYADVRVHGASRLR